MLGIILSSSLIFVLQLIWVSWMIRFCKHAQPTIAQFILKIVYAGQFLVLTGIVLYLVVCGFSSKPIDVSLLMLLSGYFLGTLGALNGAKTERKGGSVHKS